MKSSSRLIAPVALSLLAIAASATAAPPPAAPPAADKEKTSYAIGMQVGADLAQKIHASQGEVDPAPFVRGLSAVVLGTKPQMTMQDAQTIYGNFAKRQQEKAQAAQAQAQAQQVQAMAKMQAQAKILGPKNLAAGKAFLAANGKKPGVKTTASGMQYQVIKMGTGPKPKPSDTVKVNYRGTLLDGSEFDSSAKNGGPISFQVSGVIRGWTEGLQLMNPGSKFVFWIPGNLAYGERMDTPGGPNALMKFEVELISIGK